jgi:ATP-dependent Clp protease adapter protein ClpS
MAETPEPKKPSRRSGDQPNKSGKTRRSGSTKAKTRSGKSPQLKSQPREHLPQWKVLLHNDDDNDVPYVVQTIQMLTRLDRQEAKKRTMEAHHEGVSLLLVTHRERAELYHDQFLSRGLTVTIEPES